MTFLCERCKREIFKNEVCSYCNKKICNSCIKSSERFQKTTRIVICKDCWGNVKRRNAFRNNRIELKSAVASQE